MFINQYSTAMQNKYLYIIRVVAILMATTALYSLLGLIKVIWWKLTFLSNDDHWQEVIDWSFIWYVGLALLWLLTVISAYGLFRVRSWAWRLAFWVLTVDLLIRLSGIIHIWLHRQPGPPPAFNTDQGGVVVIGSFSHWPVYLMTTLSLIIIIILLQKPIRSLFKTIHSSDS